MITNSKKQKLIIAARSYIQNKGFSQADLSRFSSVPERYLIEMFKENFSVFDKAGKETVIADKYFKRLADTIDFPLEKQYWETRATDQLRSISSALLDAKANGEPAVITGQTGCGKSYACKLLQKQFPDEVFIIVVGSSDNLGDLLNKVLMTLKVSLEVPRTKSARLNLIKSILRKMNEDGKDPVLIFDEAEYMKQPALCAFKELYDGLNDLCALVLIGTQQLTDNLTKLRARNKPGIPQLYRRIKYRIKELPKIDKSFKHFLNGYDAQLKNWLKVNCDNYGELHDVLVPALREADRTGRDLDVEFVKMVVGIN